MDRKKFFAHLRKRHSGVFGTSLTQAQVEGCEAILDACRRHGVVNPEHVAHILAHVYHETGHYMLPIKETVYRSHKNKLPSDATVKRRLENAWKQGKLPWVKTPYWRDGAFGRGPIQITHWHNYEKTGKRLRLDLRNNPDLVLDPEIGADTAVVGMAEGMYTGKRLSDYRFPDALTARWDKHPRRIVNGKDGTDSKIASYHRGFREAIRAGGDKVGAGTVPPPRPQPPAPPVTTTPAPPITPTPPAPRGWARIFAALLNLLKGGKS